MPEASSRNSPQSAVVAALFMKVRVNHDPLKIKMAKQKFRPARLGGFSGTKAYIVCRDPEKTP
jgi:hypothetical protein